MPSNLPSDLPGGRAAQAPLGPSTGSRPSWALFCMHKAASSFVGHVLGSLFAASGFTCADLDRAAFEQGIDGLQYVKANSALLTARNHLFGPFRSALAAYVAGQFPARPIVQIRDPRDCLVSLYFSLAYSHPAPGPGPLRDGFLATRAFLQKISVDEGVLWWVRDGYGQLAMMRDIVKSRPDAILCRYEEMVVGFGRWLSAIIDAAELDLPADLVDRLAAETDFVVTENKFNHKRQVAPGDFRRKLRPETQRYLTERFEAELRYFGYALR